MGTLTLRNDKYAIVTADPARALFSLAWKCAVPSDVFRKICIQAYMQVMQHKLRFWLSDSRRRGPIPIQDEEWIIKDLTPRMFQIGLEKLAIVTSMDPGYKASIGRIVDEGTPRSPFPVAVFEEPEVATRWLLEKVTTEA